MWYNRLSESLLKEGYMNDTLCPCVFIKWSQSGYVIIAVYVDDLNIIGTSNELKEACAFLKNELKMKDLGETKSCISLHIEHLSQGVLVHQSTYVEKVRNQFCIDKSFPLRTPMMVRLLDIKKDLFRPKEDNEELLGPGVPYLSAIRVVLMYLTNFTMPNIAFVVNLLARHSSTLTKRHWNGVKHLLRYLKCTID